MLRIFIYPDYLAEKRLRHPFVAAFASRQLCTSRGPLLAASCNLLAEDVDPKNPIVAGPTISLMSIVSAAAFLTAPCFLVRTNRSSTDTSAEPDPRSAGTGRVRIKHRRTKGD